MADNKAIGATAIKPDKKEGFAGCMEFLYNKKDGTVLGRTGKSWGLILLFYIIYYACLAGFWALMLFVFFQIRDTENSPVYTGAQGGLIGSEPGLGIRPTQAEDNIGSSVIYLKQLKEELDQSKPNLKDKSNLGYASRLKEFFLKYDGDDCKTDCDKDCKKTCKSLKAVDCPGKATDNRDAFFNQTGSFCNFNLATIKNCKDWPYGYGPDLKPCVFLKLNRMLDFDPKPYSGGPLDGENGPYVVCDGEFPADEDYFTKNKITYFPNQTFPLMYYPMMTKEQDQTALVALQFSNLPVGRMIQVICKVYYATMKDGKPANIEHKKKIKKGLVQFQLFVEN